MFDLPGMEMMGSILGGVSPLVGGLEGGMAAGGAIADAASSAWDFGAGAVENLGRAFDPSLIAGPFMPSSGSAGAGAAGGGAGQTGDPLPLGLMDYESAVDGQVQLY